MPRRPPDPVLVLVHGHYGNSTSEIKPCKDGCRKLLAPHLSVLRPTPCFGLKRETEDGDGALHETLPERRA